MTTRKMHICPYCTREYIIPGRNDVYLSKMDHWVQVGDASICSICWNKLFRECYEMTDEELHKLELGVIKKLAHRMYPDNPNLADKYSDMPNKALPNKMSPKQLVYKGEGKSVIRYMLLILQV